MNNVLMHNRKRLAYDDGGRETARNLGNGLTTTRSYLADNQIQSIATPTVETLTYTYDAKGNMTTDDRGCGMTWDFDSMLQSSAANGVTDLKNATTNMTLSADAPPRMSQSQEEHRPPFLYRQGSRSRAEYTGQCRNRLRSQICVRILYR